MSEKYYWSVYGIDGKSYGDVEADNLIGAYKDAPSFILNTVFGQIPSLAGSTFSVGDLDSQDDVIFIMWNKIDGVYDAYWHSPVWTDDWVGAKSFMSRNSKRGRF